MTGDRPILLSYPEALQKLKKIKQEHLFSFWNRLTINEKTNLLTQISALDSDFFIEQQKLIAKHTAKPIMKFEPFSDYSPIGNSSDKRNGLELISKGKVGCLIAAGGQGTRLRFNGPKGMFPISVIQHKTLFQLFAEKVIAAGKQANHPLSLAIMTSPQNHLQTIDFFKEHENFGLDPDQIDFFSQNELPLLDMNGNLFLDSPFSIAKGPDGNGTSLEHFFKQGLFNKWRSKGIEILNYILIDNPLADPFDSELIGFHARNKCQVTVKCIERTSAEENVGLLVQTEHGVSVIEYSEMDENEKKQILPDGSLKHKCANISLFCLNIDCIQQIVESKPLPWHLAKKATPFVNTQGSLETANRWKFEKFIFDIFPRLQNLKVLLYPRSSCFAPLKNETGIDSIQTVQNALLAEDIAILEKITGNKIEHKKIELSQDFHYPTPELIEQWKHKIPNNIIYKDENDTHTSR